MRFDELQTRTERELAKYLKPAMCLRDQKSITESCKTPPRSSQQHTFLTSSTCSSRNSSPSPASACLAPLSQALRIVHSSHAIASCLEMSIDDNTEASSLKIAAARAPFEKRKAEESMSRLSGFHITLLMFCLRGRRRRRMEMLRHNDRAVLHRKRQGRF